MSNSLLVCASSEHRHNDAAEALRITLIAWRCCAIRVSVDVLYPIHVCALGISPVTSYSGVTLIAM